MNASELGSSDWWLVVQSSPFDEAERLLKDYKSTLLVNKVGTPEYVAAGALISRVNSEIHRLSQLQDRASLTVAIRNVYGQEGVDAVMTERARLRQLEAVVL